MNRFEWIARQTYGVKCKRYYALLVTLLLVTACQSNGAAQANRFSGVIEGTKVNVVTEIGGRIVRLAADEG